MFLSLNNKRKAVHIMLHNVVILHVYLNDWENPIKTKLIISEDFFLKKKTLVTNLCFLKYLHPGVSPFCLTMFRLPLTF